MILSLPPDFLQELKIKTSHTVLGEFELEITHVPTGLTIRDRQPYDLTKNIKTKHRLLLFLFDKVEDSYLKQAVAAGRLCGLGTADLSLLRRSLL